ncbi:MAG: hypothetical protein Q9221_005674 [Calogaya cf. arnoldii]
MYPHWAVIWVVCVYSARALFLPSLEEDRTARPLHIRQTKLGTCRLNATDNSSPLCSYSPESCPKICTDTCFNLTAPLSEDCYQMMNVGEYLITWPLSNMCEVGELWSMCYIRLATGKSGVDCTNLDSPSCDVEIVKALMPNVDASIAPLVRYVIASMQNVYLFFREWAEVTKTLDRNDTVLQKLRKNPLNLTRNGEVDLGNYHTALTMGLPYLAYQEDGKHISHIRDIPIAESLYDLAQDFTIKAIQKVPILIDFMWPADGSTLSDTDDVFRAGLSTLFTSIQRFVAFATYGSWASLESIDRALVLHNVGLTLAASTLFTTTALLQNGFVVVPDPALVKDPVVLIPAGHASESCIPVEDGTVGLICDSLDGSPAAARYWSAITGRLYNFQVNVTSTAGKATLASGKTNAKQMLIDIVYEGYADVNVMFDGGYDCQSQGFFGALLRVATNGRMDFDCFSSLPMFIQNRQTRVVGTATQSWKGGGREHLGAAEEVLDERKRVEVERVSRA